MKKIDDCVHINQFMSTGRFLPGTVFFRDVKKKHWCVICPACSYDEYVKAGLCEGVFISYNGSLKEGKRPCRCSDRFSWSNEQYAYRIKKETGYDVAYVSKHVRWRSSSKVKLFCNQHGIFKSSINDLLSKKSGCPFCAGFDYNTFYINFIKDKDLVVGFKYGITRKIKKRLQDINLSSCYNISNFKIYNLSNIDCVNLEKHIKTVFTKPFMAKQDFKDGYTETVSPCDIEKLLYEIDHFLGIL